MKALLIIVQALSFNEIRYKVINNSIISFTSGKYIRSAHIHVYVFMVLVSR